MAADENGSISLCMIVKDEEKRLPACLGSVRGIADEIIVVDTGSSDHTVRTAERFGAKVFRVPWRDSFAEARNDALDRAEKDWILVMDADEVLEREDREHLLAAARNGEADVYCGRTLCYSGGGVLINRNVRLIRNKRGFRYRGRVHEQLVRRVNGREAPFRMADAEIRFHHYGYLLDCIREKNKHGRNTALIAMELADHPGDPFMLFCLGNEYFCTGETEKALACYRQSLAATDLSQNYAPALLVRLVMCCDVLRRDSELFRYVRIGLRRCPDLTDLVFLRGNALLRRNRLNAAARAYLACVRMGDPPDGASSVLGVGSFLPELALADVYGRLGENGKALKHCARALQACPGLTRAAERAADLLLRQGRSVRSAAKRLCGMVPESAASRRMLSGVWYERNAFREAMRLAARAEELEPGCAEDRYRQGMCAFRLRKYRRAYALFDGVPEGSLRRDAVWMRFFCAELAPASAGRRRGALRGLSGPRLAAARAYRALLRGKSPGSPVFPGENPAACAEAVFDLLEALLAVGEKERFRQALALVEPIAEKGTLLRLGKLYHRFGCAGEAFRTLEQAIRTGGTMDAEGLRMLAEDFGSV